MGLDVFDIFFWWIGKVFWLWLSKRRRKTSTLSDGAYQVIGFIISFLLVIFFIFAYLILQMSKLTY